MKRISLAFACLGLAVLIPGTGHALPFWGKIGKLIARPVNPDMPSPGGANPPSLKFESQNRIVQSLNGKLNITNGEMKKNVSVTADQFFTRYAADFGLKLNQTDIPWKEISAVKDGEAAYQGFRQMLKTPGGMYLVDGSRALLTVVDGKVVYFSQNFIPGLDQVITDTTPKISQEDARKIAEKSLGLFQENTAPLLSLIPFVAEKSWAVASLFGGPNSEAPAVMPEGPSLTGGPNSEAALPPDDSLIIAFDGPREAKYARLAWNVKFDLKESGYFTVLVDAMTGKILKKDDGIDYADTPDFLAGKNIPSKGLPYPFYGKSDAVNFTASENPKIETDKPYVLFCDKTDASAPADSSCTANIVMYDGIGKKTTSPVTDDDNFFDKQYQRPIVSAFLYLQRAGRYFMDSFNWSGFRNKKDDVIKATVKKAVDSNNSPSAFYKSDADGGPGTLTFDGTGNAQLTPPTAMDTVGHEYFHGIFRDRIGAKDQESVEIGMMNEGLADFFGKVIEYKWEPNPATKWKFGAQDFLEKGPDNFIHDLSNPNSKEKPAMYDGLYYVSDKDCTGGGSCYRKPDLTTVSCTEDTAYCDRVHRNSLVISHMLQLLADGGDVTNELKKHVTIQGIGNQYAASVAWKTLFHLIGTDGMKDFCKKAIDSAASLTNGPDDPDIKKIIVKSTRNACFAVNLADRDENRIYEPSEKAGDNMKVDPWPATLTWQALAGEDKWRVEVSDFPPDVNFAADPNHNYLSLSAFKTKDDVFQKGDSSFVQAQFTLDPGRVYWWRICPGYAGNDDVNPDATAIPGKELLNETDCPEWREIQFFNTDKKAIKLISPANASYVTYTESGVTFTWDKVPGAKLYNVKTYARNQDGTADKSNPGTIVGTPDKATFLEPEAGKKSLCWSVIAISAEGNENNSITDEPEPNCYQIKPAKVELNSSWSLPYSNDPVKFTWKPAGGAASYLFTFCARDPISKAPNCGIEEITQEIQAPNTSTSLANAASDPNGGCWKVVGKSVDEVPGDDPPNMECYTVENKPVITSPTEGQVIKAVNAAAIDVPLTWTGFPSPNGYMVIFTNKKGNDGTICTTPKKGSNAWELTGQQCLTSSPIPTGNSIPFSNVGNWIDTGDNTIVVAALASGCHQGDTTCILGDISFPRTFKVEWGSTCGNGKKELGEACDDPNIANGDGCDNDPTHGGNCTPTACGNGVVTAGEVCGEPGLPGCPQGSDCINCQCKAIVCGDGIKEDPPEACDDGSPDKGIPNGKNGQPNHCNTTCSGLTPPQCGNQIIEAGEQCEVGNLNGHVCPSGTTGTPTCTAQCTVDTSSCKKTQNCANLAETPATGISPCYSDPNFPGYCVVPNGGGITFSWNPVSGAASYHFNVTAVSYGGGGPLVSGSSSGPSGSVNLPSAAYGTEWCVNIYPVNACGQEGAHEGLGACFYSE